MFPSFLHVSSFLLEGLHYYNDKVTIGLVSCKVYNQYNVKRCYNCQKFGHYVKECPTKEVPICGKCSENHQTKYCETFERKCINCVNNNIEHFHNDTSSKECLLLIKEQNNLKKMHLGRQPIR